jgi:excisionase family DNA binding protein
MAEEDQSRGSASSPEWLTIEQAADWLQVSTKTIRRYIEAGTLPAVNLGGRAIRIRRQDLEAWLETRRIEPGISLRSLERQERHDLREERRQRVGRALRPPRHTTPEELERVNVSIAQEDPLILQCKNCGTTWTPELHSNGRLKRGGWCCPKGCNCT